MHKIIRLLFVFLFVMISMQTVVLYAMTTEKFSFQANGKNVVGMISLPDSGEVNSIVIYVHGYGSTNVVEGNWYYDMRERFARWGIALVIWDKPGCGESEGEFDVNQPVASSAEEVIAAAQALKTRKIPGANKIGLWSLSRGGWIAPIAITREPLFDYWISVSGPTAEENFKYLLEENFRVNGKSKPEVALLVGEWQAAFDAIRLGKSYEAYLNSDKNLRQNKFYKELTGGAQPYDERAFLNEQKRYLSGEYKVNSESGLFVYVEQFPEMLSALNIPVLAIYGELDTNIDWRKSKVLYERTIGKSASLTVRSFPKADHMIKKSETGGIREAQSINYSAPYVEGYYDTMLDWLQNKGFTAL